MRRFIVAACCVVVVTMTSGMAAGELRVTILTTSAFAVKAEDRARADEVIALDAVQQLARGFSQGMPGEPSAARAWLSARLNGEQGRAFLAALEPAMTGLVRAWSAGISAVPAVLVEADGQRFVLYGTTAVKPALQRWRQLPQPARHLEQAP